MRSVSLVVGVVAAALSSVVVADETYDVGLACRSMEFSLASYCCGNLGHGAATWTCDACKYQPQMLNVTVVSSGLNKDANGFVAYDPDAPAIVVAFAGTDPLSLIDWIDDLTFIQEDYPPCKDSGCKVHKGFYDTYNAVADEVWAAVEKLWTEYGQDVPFQVTGHSLGASLASFCAMDIYLKAGVQPQYVYTYGQPRTGNEEFEIYYHDNIATHWRVTHHRDPVPHLPLESMGYHHMPWEVYYGKDPNGTYKLCDGTGEDPNCADQYWIEETNIFDHLDYMGFDVTSNYLSCKL